MSSAFQDQTAGADGQTYGRPGLPVRDDRQVDIIAHRAPAQTGNLAVHSARPAPAARGRLPRPAGSLPPAIAFLAAYGVAPGVLVDAAARAAREGSRPEEVLLAGGEVGEEVYFRALARHLGLPFVTDEVELAAGACFPHSIAAGVAPLASAQTGGLAWAMAPQGRRLDELLLLQRRRALPAGRFAIVTPARLRDLVFSQHGAAIAAMAAQALPQWRPDLSAREPVSSDQKRALAALAVLLVSAAALGGPVWLVLSCLAGVLLAGSILVRLFAAAASCERAAAPALAQIEDRDLPVFTVVAGLYREAAVAPQLAAALQALHYPPGKLDIKLVTEADDEATRAALHALNLPANYQILTVPDGFPRTKPRALNVALPLARGSLICVFDAEDMPEPDQLRAAAAAFAIAPDDVACLQARLAIDNARDGWLTRLFAIEYAALFDVVNPGLAWLRAPIPLGGTSNHFRTEVLRQVRGWDAWNVTEDIDLGLRLARMGYRVETLAAVTDEEAPAQLGVWMRQRRRWFKGWLQTALVHMREPRQVWRELGLLRTAIAAIHIGGSIFGSMLGPLFVATTTYDLVYGDLLRPTTALELVAATCWCFVFTAGLAAAFWPIALGIRRRKLQSCAGWALTLPFYWLLQTVAAWWALLDLMRNPFHWHKTEHGKARTSRRLAGAA